MKTLRIITSVLAIVALIKFSSCSPDDPTSPTLQQLAFEKLAGDWILGTVGSIVVDGQDLSLNYPGFSLSFTDGGYATSNAGDLFNATGTWTWTDEEAGEVSLDDGKVLTIATLTENVFKFTFDFAGTGGVANGIGGSYEITVVK